jgi:hypothetical protein
MTIFQRVERERRRARRLELAGGAAAAAAVVFGVVAASGMVLGDARWLALPRALPALVWLFVTACLAVMARRTRRQLAARTSRPAVAAAIEREHALRAGSLRGAMEVADAGPFGQRAAQLAADALPSVEESLVPRYHATARQRLLRVRVAALLTAVLLVVVAPVWSDGLLAVLRPVSAWRGTLLAPLRFERLPEVVMRGDTIHVRIAAAGRSTVQLQSRVTGEGWRRQTLHVAPTGTATAVLGPLRGELTVVAADGRSTTDTARVRVADRPFVGAITIRAEYPAYLDRAAETLPVGEPIVVPRGTALELAGHASVPLQTAGLVRDGDTTFLLIRSRAFAGRLVPAGSATWRWFARGDDAAVADLPDPLDVAVVPDSAPQVEILAPSADTVVAALDTVSIQGVASDDHGLQSVELHGWRDGPGGASEAVRQSLLSTRGAAWGGTVQVDLSSLHLTPGEAFHLNLSAVDNSPWAQRSTSRELVLRVPGMDERRAMARAAADSAVQAVRRTATAEGGIEQRTAEMSRSRLNRDEMRTQDGKASDAMGYEAAEQARALVKEQRDLADRVTQLRQGAERLREQLKRAGALDSALSDQLHDAQRMLRQALTPELQAELQQLDQSAQALDAKGADQSLANLAAMQARLREQLEKSAQMLQRAAFEGAMQTLHDEAADIAKGERALGDSAGHQPDAGAAVDSAGHQADAGAGVDSGRAGLPTVDQRRALGDRSAALSTATRALQQQLAEAGAHAGARNVDQAHTFASASTESMTSRGDVSTAAAEMQRAAQSMKQARDQQVSEWQGQLKEMLDRAVQDLLQLSRQEQAMEQDMRTGTAKPGEVRGRQGAVQQGVDQVRRELQEQAQRSSLVSGRAQQAVADAQQQVSEATQSASDPRNAPQTPATLAEAADALNRAAAALARDRQRVNTAKSASGFSEMLQQLQEAARKQGSINAQAQALLPMPGQGQMSPQAQAAARLLAGQERGLARHLDDVSDAVGGDRAAQLAREARAVAEALDRGRVDAATVARQEQLLQHMLDAGRSLQKDEREDTGQREAESAVHPRVFTPQAGSASGQSAVRYRVPTWDELRGYPADERRAIMEYFRRINGGSAH